jgi:hypothetical protein
MATTKLADIIVPEVLAKMASAEISNYLDFEKTGLATRDYNNVDIRSGGNFAEIPFYIQIDGDNEPDEVLTDNTSLTPGKITTGKDIGVVLHRGKAWGSRDLAGLIQGDDPQKEIAKQVAQYWSRRIRTTCINLLNGVFASNGPLGSGATNPHINDVSVGTGTAVPITASAALDTFQLLGDAMEGLDVFICHSKVYTDIVKAQLVTYSTQFDPKSYNPKDRGKFLGMDIIVTDNMPVDTGTPSFYKYTSYIAKKGCMYLGRQKDLMSETDRDILAQEDVLATTIHYVPHVKLCKWNTTDTNPTNALLATGTQWVSVANDHKFIPIVAIVTN